MRIIIIICITGFTVMSMWVFKPGNRSEMLEYLKGDDGIQVAKNSTGHISSDCRYFTYLQMAYIMDDEQTIVCFTKFESLDEYKQYAYKRTLEDFRGPWFPKMVNSVNILLSSETI